MARLAGPDCGEGLEAEFDRLASEEDDTASRAMLAAGWPIHVVHDDTPSGHVVRVHPDGREELIRVDRGTAAHILGE